MVGRRVNEAISFYACFIGKERQENRVCMILGAKYDILFFGFSFFNVKYNFYRSNNFLLDL